MAACQSAATGSSGQGTVVSAAYNGRPDGDASRAALPSSSAAVRRLSSSVRP
ncbi:Uncharacterised protein [Mycobacteroides abscessus subsp. abscessus]|nr:Uncharacterised protein [Mycobacteroides abscessus subsp. abscessus]